MIPQMDFQLHTAMCQCSHCQSRRDAAVANEHERPFEAYQPREEDGVIIQGPQS